MSYSKSSLDDSRETHPLSGRVENLPPEALSRLIPTGREHRSEAILVSTNNAIGLDEIEITGRHSRFRLHSPMFKRVFVPPHPSVAGKQKKNTNIGKTSGFMR